VIRNHQRHRQTDRRTDGQTDRRTSSDPMTATLLKHVAVKTSWCAKIHISGQRVPHVYDAFTKNIAITRDARSFFTQVILSVVEDK